MKRKIVKGLVFGGRDSLKDDAVAAAIRRPCRLDLESHFGSFVECLSNATIQDSGAFYAEIRYHRHSYGRWR